MPYIVGLFHVDNKLAYNECSDKCGNAQGSINRYVKTALYTWYFHKYYD